MRWVECCCGLFPSASDRHRTPIDLTGGSGTQMDRHWRRISKRDRILVFLLLRTAAWRAARLEKLRREIDALNMLCESDSLFATVVRPIWTQCSVMGTTRQAFCELIASDDALSLRMKILDAASIGLSTDTQ